MSNVEVVDATELIDDVRTLLSIAIVAMRKDTDVIHVSEDLTCSPEFMVRAALNLVDTMIGDEVSEPTQTLLSSVKAQLAIFEAAGH